MALLMFQPLFYVYGVDAVMWREVCSAFLPWDGVWGGTVGTAVGAWCGAIPIPLDWYVVDVSLVARMGKERKRIALFDWMVADGVFSDLGIANGRNGLSLSSPELILAGL